MTKLTLALIDSNNDIIIKDSHILKSTESKEMIEAIVFLCSKMDIDVPIWTLAEEKSLSKYNEVLIRDAEYGDKTLKISLEPA